MTSSNWFHLMLASNNGIIQKGTVTQLGRQSNVPLKTFLSNIYPIHTKSFQLLFDLKLNGSTSGMGFGVFFGYSDENDAYPPNNNLATSISIMFQLYNDDNSYGGDQSVPSGVYLFKNGNVLAQAPLPTFTNDFSPIDISYNKGSIGTWTVKYNDTILLSYSDINNYDWIQSTSGGNRKWGFISSVDAGSWHNSYIRNVNVRIPGYVCQDFNNCCQGHGIIVIDSSITNIPSNALLNCKSLKSIFVPPTVNTIGAAAFMNCSNLQNIVLPPYLISIPDKLFYGTSSLNSIKIPATIVSIGSYSFYKSNVSSILLPGELITLGDYVFSESNLQVITLPNSVTFVGKNSFAKCSFLEQVTLSSNMKNISDLSFWNCKSLKYVSIPMGIQYLNFASFGGCSSLNSISLPTSVIALGVSVFQDCIKLAQVNIANSFISIGAGAFQNTNFTLSTYNSIRPSVTPTLSPTRFPTTKPTKIPTTIQTSLVSPTESPTLSPSRVPTNDPAPANGYLCTDTTSCCQGNADVILSSSIKNISVASFRDCTSLKSIYIPRSINKIPDAAFSGCKSLLSVTIVSVSIIMKGAFYGCNSLTTVNLPYGLQVISDAAFYECSSLSSISLPTSLQTIGDMAFTRCSSLVSVIIPAGVTLGLGSFQGCTKLRSVVISEHVDFVGAASFALCPSLQNVTIAEGVKSLGPASFWNCSALLSIQLPNSMTTIEDYTFSNCRSMRSVTISDSITTIGFKAFDKNPLTCINWDSYIYRKIEDTALPTRNVCPLYHSPTFSPTVISAPSNINVPIGVTTFFPTPARTPEPTALGTSTVPFICSIIGQNTGCCGNNVNVILSNTITSIMDGAFDSCNALKSITIKNTVTFIGEYAFARCTSLTTLNIPTSVKNISSFAFFGCISLKTAVVSGTIKSNAFEACTSLMSLKILQTSYIENSAFLFCTSLTSISISNTVTYIGDNSFKDSPFLCIDWNSGLNRTIGLNALPTTKACLTPSSQPTSQPSSDDDTPISISDPLVIAQSYSYDVAPDLDYPDPLFSKLTDNVYSNVWPHTSWVSWSGRNPTITYKFNKPQLIQKVAIFSRSMNSGYAPSNIIIGSISFKITIDSYQNEWLVFNGMWTASTLNIKFIYPEQSGVFYISEINLFGADAPTYAPSSNKIETLPYIECLDSIVCEIKIQPQNNQQINLAEIEFFLNGVKLTNIIEENYYMTSPVDKNGNNGVSNCFDGNLNTLCITDSSDDNPALFVNINGATFDTIKITNKDNTYKIQYASISISKRILVWKSTFQDTESTYYFNPITYLYPCIDVVNIPIGIATIPPSTYSGCTILRAISIPNTVSIIEANVFNGCSSLETVILPSTITVISSNAFKSSGLISMNIPAGVQEIQSYAFSDCARLVQVSLPNTLSILSDGAFESCKLLYDIKLPNSISILGSNVFHLCSSLISMAFPSSISMVPDGFCQGCISLNDIKFPNNILRIGYNSFSNTNVTKVILPRGLSTIDDRAFYGCKLLSVVSVPSTVSSVGSESFGSCPSLRCINSMINIPYINKCTYSPTLKPTMKPTYSRLPPSLCPSDEIYQGNRCHSYKTVSFAPFGTEVASTNWNFSVDLFQVAIDSSAGNTYIADGMNQRIIKIGRGTGINCYKVVCTIVIRVSPPLVYSTNPSSSTYWDGTLNLAEIEIYNEGAQIPSNFIVSNLSSIYSSANDVSKCFDGNYATSCSSNPSRNDGTLTIIVSGASFDAIKVYNNQVKQYQMKGGIIMINVGESIVWNSAFPTAELIYTFNIQLSFPSPTNITSNAVSLNNLNGDFEIDDGGDFVNFCPTSWECPSVAYYLVKYSSTVWLPSSNLNGKNNFINMQLQSSSSDKYLQQTFSMKPNTYFNVSFDYSYRYNCPYCVPMTVQPLLSVYCSSGFDQPVVSLSPSSAWQTITTPTLCRSYSNGIAKVKFFHAGPVGLDSSIYIDNVKYNFADSPITEPYNSVKQVGYHQFKAPYGLALDDNNKDLYCSDIIDQKVIKILQNGEASEYGTIRNGLSPSTLNKPYSLSFDSVKGILYVADFGNNRILKIVNNVVSTYGGVFDGPTSVTVETSTGNVYVAEMTGNSIKKIAPNNGPVTIYGGGVQFLTPNTYNKPQSLSVDNQNGILYVVDTFNDRMLRIEANNSYVTQYGPIMKNIRSITIDNSSGVAYVTTSSHVYSSICESGEPYTFFKGVCMYVETPTGQPTSQPSIQPTIQPSTKPTSQPSIQPSRQPTCQPSLQPSMQPSMQPSSQPLSQPSCHPTRQPSLQPSSQPSLQPSTRPTSQPTCQPSRSPTHPSSQPTSRPSRQPSVQPSGQPSCQPSLQPSSQPSTQPSSQPSLQPSVQPSVKPSSQPSCFPTCQPSSMPTNPTSQPSRQPSSHPSSQPSLQPSVSPTSQPSLQPSGQPSTQPSVQPTSQPSSMKDRLRDISSTAEVPFVKVILPYVNCTKLYRYSYKNTNTSCGTCIPDYVGDESQELSQCVQKNIANKVMKRCPNDCSGNGTCTYFDVNSGATTDECTIVTLTCTANCVCNDGFYDNDCSMNITEKKALEAKQADILLQISVAASLDISDKTFVEKLINSSVSILATTTKEEMSSDSIAVTCDVLKNTVSSASKLDLPLSTIKQYDTVVSNVIANAVSITTNDENNSNDKKIVQNLYENFVDTLGSMAMKNIMSGGNDTVIKTSNMNVIATKLQQKQQISSLTSGSPASTFEVVGKNASSLNIPIVISVTRASLYAEEKRKNITQAGVNEKVTTSNPIRIQMNCSLISKTLVKLVIQNNGRQDYSPIHAVTGPFYTVCLGNYNLHKYTCRYSDGTITDIKYECQMGAAGTFKTGMLYYLLIIIIIIIITIIIIIIVIRLSI